MFKLVKILNSGTNVAEPVKVPANKELEYKIGSAVKIASGVCANVIATEKPTYIVAKNCKKGESDTVLVYPINENMIFETKFSATPTGICVGDKVTLSLDGACATGVSATKENGVCEIVEIYDNKSTEKEVYIKFN